MHYLWKDEINVIPKPNHCGTLAWTRCWHSLGLALFFTLGIFLTDTNASSPQLIKAASQEGKVVYYHTMSITDADKVTKAFNKKYPDIRVELMRTTKEKLITRLLAEDSAGRTIADAVSVNDVVMHLLRIKGILGKYDNPEAAAYGPEFKDRNGYWTGLYGASAVLVYNTKLVKPTDVPKSWDDLLDPKWKGKMGMDGSKWEWFAAQLQIMGREKGLAFMSKLAAQDLQYRTGLILLAELTGTGEFPLTVYSYAGEVEELMARGAPLAWVPFPPVFMNLIGVGPTAKAPHPNAAKLLVEFLTSKEGQTVISNRGPVRADVSADPPRLTQGIKFFTLKPEIAEKYQEYEALFFKTFGIRQ